MAIINTAKLEIERDDGNTYVFDKNLGATVIGQEMFSTEETITGKWINGKPIYSKVLETTITNQADVGIDVGTMVDEYIYIGGEGYDSNSSYAIAWRLPFARHDSFAYQIGIQGNTDASTSSGSQRKNSIRLMFGTSVANRTWRIRLILQYTKVTDAPNSYKPASTELTEEHLTGETLEGKPVYEKTFLGKTRSSSGTYEIADLANLDIAYFLGAYGQGMQNNGNWTALSYYNSSTNQFMCYYNSTQKKLMVAAGSYHVNSNYSITIKYTKTTD